MWMRRRLWLSTCNGVGASLTILLFAGQPTAFVAYLGILGWIPLGALALWIVLTGRLRPETVGRPSLAAAW